jgi:hypothetical protein
MIQNPKSKIQKMDRGLLAYFLDIGPWILDLRGTDNGKS